MNMNQQAAEIAKINEDRECLQSQLVSTKDELSVVIRKFAFLENHINTSSLQSRHQPEDVKETITTSLRAELHKQATSLKLEVNKVTATLKAKCNDDQEARRRGRALVDEHNTIIEANLNMLIMKMEGHEAGVKVKIRHEAHEILSSIKVGNERKERKS